ncbi:hypothetical protein E4T25_08925 [Photobacterium damselae subsp. piscicida]|uniref:hypothetical protein n=1 Tax=Photobacterium damselae TaxID=38293 RepID=UPI0010763C3F|nr:hypothetical protein [Photobacterium damselae]TFZ60115.1 hypothetical protein E4T25_08925 [Photobacterium damselae subsp. piscicida]
MINTYTEPKDLMMRIRFLVSNGYVFYTTGECKITQQQKLIFKFSDRYHIDIPPGKRQYRKKIGRTNTALVFHQTDDSKMLTFWLFATEGEGMVFELEYMQDSRKKSSRISIANGDYELLRLPRPNDKARWTWVVTQEKYNILLQEIKLAIRHKKDKTLRQLHFKIVRIYGFSGMRKQGFALLNLMKKEWIRTRKEEYPFTDPYIGYLKIAKKKID